LEITELLSKITKARRVVPVCIRGDLATRAEELRSAWHAQVEYDREHNEPPGAPLIFDELLAVEQEAEAATVEFVIQPISATAWRRLIAEHPPPPGDLEGWRWDLETFPPAALAACTVDPAMTEKQASELADTLTNGQFQKLWGAVVLANAGDDIVPKFASATGDRPTTEQSSATAPPEGSLIASS
jgi:hypothetical protein